MQVNKVYISTYKYDFQFAKICIASVRYWYPNIPIVLIKDEGAGRFDTVDIEKKWNLSLFDTKGKKFGWGYSKLEPLFLPVKESFLVLDADTVMVGPILDRVRDMDAQFIVDEEVQPAKRFNEIYYNLERIKEIDKNFVYPGFSFNSGQWFGTSCIIQQSDFERTLDWTNPPKPKYPEIVFNGDQAHLNFLLHAKLQAKEITLARMKMMIWPSENCADFIRLDKISEGKGEYPFVIHWAGMKFKNMNELSRPDIIRFFKEVYYSKSPGFHLPKDNFSAWYLYYEKKVRLFGKNLKRSISKP